MDGDRFYLVSKQGDTTEISDGMYAGRSPSCDLVIEDTQASRQHARFIVSSSGLAVQDLESINGTFVQGQRIRDVHALKQGDSLGFGPVTFEVQVEPVDDDGKTVIAVAPILPAGPSRIGAGSEVHVEQPPAADAEQAQSSSARTEGEEHSTDDEDLGAGLQGAIEVMPLNENLPPVWASSESPRTLFVNRVDMKAGLENAPQALGDKELLDIERRTDAPTLLMLSGEDAGRPYKLHSIADLSFWTIGKPSTTQELSIRVNDPSVSDFHAKLVHKSGRWKIVDQMSTNHTYVNGQQYNSAFLSSRDIIQFGAVHAVFLLPAEIQAAEVGMTGKPSLWQRLKTLIRISGKG